MIDNIKSNFQIELFQAFLLQLKNSDSFKSIIESTIATLKILFPDSSTCLWMWDDKKNKTYPLSYKESQCNSKNCIKNFKEKGLLKLWLLEGNDVTIHKLLTKKDAEFDNQSNNEIFYVRIVSSSSKRYLLFICQNNLSLVLNESLQSFLVLLAHQFTYSIENHRNKLERNLLANLSNLSNESTNRDDFFDEAAKIINTSFISTGCTIFRYENIYNKLLLGGTTGIIDPLTGEDLNYVEYQLGEGCTGWIASNNKIIRLYDASDKNEWLEIDSTGAFSVSTKSQEKSLVQISGPRSFLGAPILLCPLNKESKLVGVIRLHKKINFAGFSPFDEEMIESVSNVLASFMERWNTNAKIEKQMALQHSLFEIIEAMHFDIDSKPNFILDTIASQAMELFKTYSCSVLLKIPNEEKLRVVLDIGPHDKMDKEIIVNIGEGIVGHSALERKTIIVSDVNAISQEENYKYLKILDDVKSEICTPIIFNEQCLGVLNMDSDKVNCFQKDDLFTIQIFETFAKQAAIALHRSQVLEERTQWRKNLVRTTEILTASSIASGLAHELKNGLAAISGLAQNLETSELKIKKSNQDILQKLREKSRDLYNLSIKIMNSSKVGEPQKKICYLNEIINEGLYYVDNLVKDSNLKLNILLDPILSRPKEGTGCQIYVDDKQIQQVLINLVLNAIDASFSGKNIEISSKKEDEYVRFSVKDFGKGIEQEDKKNLFNMFFTTKSGGFGVGLAVVKILIEDNHKGKIEVETKINRGSMFSVVLPIQKSLIYEY